MIKSGATKQGMGIYPIHDTVETPREATPRDIFAISIVSLMKRVRSHVNVAILYGADDEDAKSTYSKGLAIAERLGLTEDEYRMIVEQFWQVGKMYSHNKSGKKNGEFERGDSDEC